MEIPPFRIMMGPEAPYPPAWPLFQSSTYLSATSPRKHAPVAREQSVSLGYAQSTPTCIQIYLADTRAFAASSPSSDLQKSPLLA